MKNTLLTSAKSTLIIVLVLISISTFSQQSLSKNELSINGFRNPSAGIEFRHKFLSYHAGYYPTAFKAGENWDFIKIGVTGWFLPVGQKENPSSFYATASYLRGFTREYDGKNALGAEVGFRWMVYKGLNLRLGVIAVAAPGESVKINPTPGISYSFFFK